MDTKKNSVPTSSSSLEEVSKKLAETEKKLLEAYVMIIQRESEHTEEIERLKAQFEIEKKAAVDGALFEVMGPRIDLRELIKEQYPDKELSEEDFEKLDKHVFQTLVKEKQRFTRD